MSSSKCSDPPSQLAVDGIDARIQAYVPEGDPEHIWRARRALVQSNDRAMVRLSASYGLSDDAWKFEAIILSISARYAYRLNDADAVWDAAKLCIRLRRCATQLDVMEGGYAF